MQRYMTFAAIWIVLVLAGLLVFQKRPPAPVAGFPVATRDMPANRLLQPGDLAFTPPGDARYLARTVMRDEALRPGDLAALPSIPSASAVTVAVNPLRVRGGLNAGSVVTLCAAGAAAAEKVTVRGVVCQGDACLAIVQVSPDQARALVKAGTPSVADGDSCK